MKYVELTCFWCMQKNGVTILNPDEETPSDEPVVVNYEPCNSCMKKLSEGNALIEVSLKPLSENQQAFPVKFRGKKCYPSGRYAVMTDDGLREVFNDEAVERITKYKQALIDEDSFERLFVKKVH